MTTTVNPSVTRPAPTPARAQSQPSSLDEAFNAGFSVEPVESSSSRPSSYADSRAVPTRPEMTYTDPLPAEPTETIELVSNTPRYETYTVQSGDSLWKIARDYKVTVNQLLEANGLAKNSVIQVGQRISIPLTAPELVPIPNEALAYEGTGVSSSDMQPYTVQPGDNLTKIANRFGTSVGAIKAANNRRNDVIRVGETLMVPAASSPASNSSPVASTPAPSSVTPPVSQGPTTGPGQFTHTVASGETPASIAARYGMRTIDLIRLNGNFDPRRLPVGRVLLIQPAPGREPAAGGGGSSSSLSSTPPPNTNTGGSIPSVEEQRRSPQPIRMQVTTTPPESADPVDPALLLDDVEEIPVIPVERAPEG